MEDSLVISESALDFSPLPLDSNLNLYDEVFNLHQEVILLNEKIELQNNILTTLSIFILLFFCLQYAVKVAKFFFSSTFGAL